MLDSKQILELRGSKNPIVPDKPYHFLHERERSAGGKVRSVNTLFLANHECSFKCVMCDLWKNTLDEPLPAGCIPQQIEYALKRLPEAAVVKLYNNGNFFDAKAIPPQDHTAIAELLDGYDHVIVENHPALTGPDCLRFRDRLSGNLEIAMGLETVHPEVLPRLNKRLTKGDFAEAASYLTANGIPVRAFVLLNPPFLTDPEENIEWTLSSVAFAARCGATTSSIIPVRGGNGAMEKLRKEGHYVPPTLGALERVFEEALTMDCGQVFADLWDLDRFASCQHCLEKRRERLARMNLEQKVLPPVICKTCNA